MAETAHSWLKPILKIIRLILATILSIGIWYLFFQLDMFESMREIDDRIGLLLIIISVLGFFSTACFVVDVFVGNRLCLHALYCFRGFIYIGWPTVFFRYSTIYSCIRLDHVLNETTPPLLSSLPRFAPSPNVCGRG